jgi:hypothetical protein
MGLIVVGYFFGDAAREWIAHHHCVEKRRLRAERKVHLAALRAYANRKNWIGSEYIGSEDPAAPARLALHAGDAEKAIKALPSSRFAEKSDQ